MNQMLPNNWHLHYMSYNKLPLGPLVEKMPHSPNNLIKNINLDDITRSHSIFQEIFWQNSQILHLYRNPLDYSVSLFNYKHKKGLTFQTDVKILARCLSLNLQIIVICITVIKALPSQEDLGFLGFLMKILYKNLNFI